MNGMRITGSTSTALAVGARSVEAWVVPAFHRVKHQRIVRWVVLTEVTLAVVLAGLSAQLLWAAFKPREWPAEPATVQVSSAAPARAIFASGILTTLDPFHRTSVAVAANGPTRAPETLLALQLFGIRSNAPGQGSAIIATPDNKQGAFFVGQEIMGGVRLEEVWPDRVIIRRNGVAETLSLDKDRTAPPVTQTAAAPVAPGRVSQSLAQLAAFVRPYREEDRAVGLRLAPDMDAAVLAPTGLEPGDIILSINGTPATDVAALAAVAASSNGAPFSLEIVRKGQRKIHTLSVDR